MPTNGTFSGAPIPNIGEANNASSFMAAYDAVVGGMLVYPVANQSDRDTKYANLKAGRLVTCPSLHKAWLKTSDPPAAPTWDLAWEYGTPVTTGVLTPGPNFSVNAQWGQRVNGNLLVAGALSYTGSTITGAPVGGPNPGNVGDTTVCTLQSGWKPPAGLPTWPASINSTFTPASGWVVSDGSIVINALTPGGTISPGDTVRFSAVIPGA